MPNVFALGGREVPVTTVSGSLTTSATSFTLGSATNAPTAPFLATIDPGLATEEVVLVGARSSTTCSEVVRGYDGRDAQEHSAGAFIVLGDYDEASFAVDSPEAAYTQTYSTANRTIAAPTSETLTDSTGGSASNTLAATVGVYNLAIPIHNLATVADGDVLTTMTVGHKFKILAVDAFVTNEVTTAAKASTLNVEIGTTDLTGGAVALTSANCATLGAKIAGSSVTAANTGTSSDTISVEASSTTAFVEGGVMLVLRIQNMDVADAFASLVDEQAKAAADDLDLRQGLSAVIDDLQAKNISG